MNTREIVFALLVEWNRGRHLAAELLEARRDIPREERGFVQELFYGCLRQKLALEFLIKHTSGKPPRRAVSTILQIGLYQRLFMRVPAHAAVHETVELAKHHLSSAEVKFVNAILRNADPVVLKNAEPWVRLSHPRWLWQRHGDAWCEWNNTPAPVYARLNTLTSIGRVTPRGESSLLRGVTRSTILHPLCVEVLDTHALFTSELWKRGEFYIQDPSTLIAVDILEPQPGESVLDLCAAPGGKTTYIAQKMENRGRIIAADLSATRLGLVAENCRRLGVKIVATLACNGLRLDRCLRGDKFDRVLVDAPCSNTGVMRRRTDLRWRIQEKELARLAELQFNLLRSAGQFTKPGGALVYSTCSMEPEENERVVERFLSAKPQFTLEATRSSMPPRDEMDGAFVARFKKS